MMTGTTETKKNYRIFFFKILRDHNDKIPRYTLKYRKIKRILRFK